MSMLMTIDRGCGVPAWKQICDHVVHLVDDGSLTPGARLPATRVLAGTLGLNRSTVYRAYQELWALGYLESRPGSYSTVRGRTRAIGAPATDGPSLIDWDAASSPAARGAYEDWRALPSPSFFADRTAVDFATLSADRDLCPIEDFRRAVRSVLADTGAEILDYGDPMGYAPLRETIARRMRTHGVTVGPDEILVTNGAQQALELALKLAARPGAVIAAESPTYSAAIPLFRFYGFSIREIPMRPSGADLDVLADVLARDRPALVYTMPNFQNPTGITTGQPHRERLLALAEQHRVPIVEDGFEEEMKYFGKAVLPIKSMDARGVVIYVGTFSKVIFPGLRVGWIAAERECVRRLLAINRFSTLSGNILGQAALDVFCRNGAYEAHLRRLHKVYRKRMQAMLTRLTKHLPADGVEWTQPAGGYTLWVHVRERAAADERPLLDELRREHVLVGSGSWFFPRPADGIYFRLSIANADEGEIEEGCRRVGRALARFLED